jgi:hypothetical protein
LAKTETEAVKTPSDSYLSLLEFQSVFEESLYRKLEPEEQRFLSNFFFTYSPIRNNALALVLLPFIATKGKDLHVRSYLDHIRISIFKSRS